MAKFYDPIVTFVSDGITAGTFNPLLLRGVWMKILRESLAAGVVTPPADLSTLNDAELLEAYDLLSALGSEATDQQIRDARRLRTELLARVEAFQTQRFPDAGSTYRRWLRLQSRDEYANLDDGVVRGIDQVFRVLAASPAP